MPSLATLGAIGGAGTGAAQSLKDILARRLEEQRLDDLRYEAEQRRLHDQAQLTALSDYRNRQLEQDESQYRRTQEIGQPGRDLNLKKIQADLDDAANDASRSAAARARLSQGGWENLSVPERYGLFVDAYGGGSPPAGALETPEERKRSREELEDIQTRGRIREITATAENRAPKEAPLSTRQVPQEASDLITRIHNKYPDSTEGEQVFDWYYQQGAFDDMGDEADPAKIKEALLKLYRTGQLAKVKPGNANPLAYQNWGPKVLNRVGLGAGEPATVKGIKAAPQTSGKVGGLSWEVLP